MFRHPKKVCMTYFSHMKFSLYLSYKFAIASFTAFVHAFLPDFFITSSSNTVNKVTKEMKKIGCREK